MLKTEAIKNVLKASGNDHLTSLYSEEMEVQVNVAQDNGERIKGTYLGKRWVGWRDPETGAQWKSFRIPWNANINPEYVDRDMQFDLANHVEGIGMTGWNWVKRTSLWVGFDFDSIVNHKEGLSNEELDHIKEIVHHVPWVTLVKSTSGKGLHLYIHFEKPIPTNNHTEHAGLARSILTILSVEAGYNFNAAVDVCGHILWCYHRKQEGTDGLSLLKEGVKFPVEKLPINWKDHIDVTSGKRRRVKTHSPNEQEFDELISSIKKIGLDEEHQKLLLFLKEKAKKDWWWDSDHNMLVCHTLDLADAYKVLGMKGIFFTNSSGSSSQNCYAFPNEKGSWIVRRHSLRVHEHPSWIVDPSGWTRCVLNSIPEFPVCARANEGIENTRGEYVFSKVSDGLNALANMNIRDINLPDFMLNRPMTIKEKQDGKIVISFVRDAGDSPIQGFLSTAKGDKWEKVIHRTKQKREVYAPDFLIRHVIANEAEAGWYIFTRKQWIQQNKSNVMTVLLSQQNLNNRNDVELSMGKAILNPWMLVNIPFETEYPGDRQWNRHAATLSCRPIEGTHDSWNSILNHVGANLDGAVVNSDWCNKNAINTGGEYLLCWIASMLQNPAEPLPYLFFVGPQNSGKSTFHEAISKLFYKNLGYARADNALINQQGFNAEISNAVLCIIEETDLKRNRDAANRIKDWVTGKTISINTKYKTVYDIVNTTHWVQCANDPGFCPVLPGDTRIVVSQVDTPKQDIPKTVLFEQLEQEKAAFLHTVLSLELPAPEGRLAIPCITTSIKQELESYNKSDLENFMQEKVKICSGEIVSFEEFFFTFQNWLPMDKRAYWTTNRVSRNYPKHKPYVKGIHGTNNAITFGNITLNPNKKPGVNEVFLNTRNNRLEWRMTNDTSGN